MRYKFKFAPILEFLIKFVFFLSFLSIPVCSFRVGLNKVTWVLTILFLVLIFINIIIKKQIKISLYFILLVGTLFSIFISVLLSKFLAFSFTPFLMVVLSCGFVLYLENNENKTKTISSFTHIVFCALICFLVIYSVLYFDNLIHFNFDRLGSDFGDINDICLFLTLGSVFSLYYIFFNKKILKIFCFALLFLMFTYAALSCGSKIFIFVLLIEFIALCVIRFGKKRWYFTLVIFSLLVVAFIAIMTIPAFSTIATRIKATFNLFTGKQTSGLGTDYSSMFRMDMFVDGLEMFARKPLFGWGPNSFFLYSSYGGGWSHNHISESLCSYGIVGTILWNSPLLLSFLSLFKTNKKNILLFIAVFFFCVMISVSLDTQKIYAFVCPLIFANGDEWFFYFKNPIKFNWMHKDR